MASPSTPSTAAHAAATDPQAWFDAWLELQSSWFDTSLAQWTSSQQSMQSAWGELMRSFGLPWAPTLTELPQAVADAWAPWLPYWQRGTEQLA
ncbi:MAG: hypothetical protein HY855_09675 [Burkholderiales bacterium]|nr:hypothetical protein [Burkholderiales bacterium]